MQDYYNIVAINPSLELEAELIALGFYNYEYQEKPNYALGKAQVVSRLSLVVPVSDQRLADVIKLRERFPLLGAYYTEFSDEDYGRAKWLEVDVVSWIGYPKPENNWREVTYDLNASSYCSKCGVGYVQSMPFRFSRSHRRGKTVSFCSPGWVHDAIFIRERVREVLISENIKGVDFGPALEAGSKTPLADVVQLIVEKTLEPGFLNLNDFIANQCPECNRQKFEYSYRVKHFSNDIFDEDLDMVMAHEWFGSGGLAFRKILVSRRFAELYQEHRWRGLTLKPVLLQ